MPEGTENTALRDYNNFQKTLTEMYPTHSQPDATEMYPHSHPEATAQGEASPNTNSDANPESHPETAQGAPEAYSFENAEQYDQKVLQSVADWAREANVTPDSAQALLSKVAPVMVQRQAERLAEIKESWASESKRDAVLSKGAGFEENLSVARRGLDAVADSDGVIHSILEETGLGNHPAVLKMFMKIGQTIAEDRFVGGRSKPTAPSPLEVMYPTHYQER